jgi:DNA-binding XRE family transcriptional regulator
VAFSHQQVANMMMRRRNPRNSLDVRDRVQVRVVRKRLKLTDAQLADIIRKSGNSISAISKEAGARQCLSLPKHTPSAAVIAASEPDAAVAMQVEAV